MSLLLSTDRASGPSSASIMSDPSLSTATFRLLEPSNSCALTKEIDINNVKSNAINNIEFFLLLICKIISSYYCNTKFKNFNKGNNKIITLIITIYY